MSMVGKRRNRADGSGESGNTVVDESTSCGEGGGSSVVVRSPPRRKLKVAVRRATVSDGRESSMSMSCVEGSSLANVAKEAKDDKVPKKAKEGQGRGECGVSKTKGVGVSNEVGSSALLSRMRTVIDKFTDTVFGMEDVKMSTARKLIKCCTDLEDILITSVTEGARLRGQVAGLSVKRADAPPRAAMTAPLETMPMAAPQAPVPLMPAPVVPKPVETWSVVVRSKTASASSKEVVEKVVKEVGPSLGVRVHEVKPLRDGGAIIRTPSVAEREKVAKNAKFSEVGLDVSVNRKLGPRVVVQGSIRRFRQTISWRSFSV